MKRLWLLLILMLTSGAVVAWYYGGNYLQQKREAEANQTEAAVEVGNGDQSIAVTGDLPVAADWDADSLQGIPLAGSWALPLDTRFQPGELSVGRVAPPKPGSFEEETLVRESGMESPAAAFVPPVFVRPGTPAMLDALLDVPGSTVIAAAGDSFYRKNLAERWPEILPTGVILAEALAPARPGEVVVRLVPPIPGARVWLGDSADLVTNSRGLVRIRNVPAGSLQLAVQAPRYEPVIGQLDVAAEGTDTIVDLQPLRGRLEVLTTPAAALVAIDEDGKVIDLGTADADGWLRKHDTLQIGTYTLRLTATNRTPAEQQVNLPVGRIIRWQEPLSPYPGQLRVVTVPVGARVDLLLPGEDVRSVGETPLSIDDVPAEEDIDIAVVLNGYRRQVKRVRLGAAETGIVNFGTLAAGAGNLKVAFENEGFDPDRAIVKVDGATDWPRRAGDSFFIEGLEAGERRVEITHPEFQPYAQVMEVIDSRSVTRSVKLTPLPAEVVVAVIGPERGNWSVDVDGSPQTPRSRLNDPADRQTFILPADEDLVVTVRASGWLDRQEPLRLRRGERRLLEFEMEREARQPTRQFSTVELPAGETMEFVRIEPGEFVMGSSVGEDGRFPDEGPQTRVRITRPFWLGKTPVTQAQWQAVMGSSLAALRDRENSNWPLHGTGPTHPVYYVSWDEAIAFCRTLTERERSAGRLPEGYSFTLPTEAQWEYAARAGSEGRWSFGDRESELDRYSWNSRNSGGRTHPVGQKAPNAWGLYDIHGNIWEWTRSWYGPYPGGSVIDYEGAPSGTTRVHRSSSWNAPVGKTRSAYRDWLEPSKRGYDLGFRVAIEQRSFTAE